MIKVTGPESTFVICYCDKCKRRESADDEIMILNRGWKWAGTALLCPKCQEQPDA